MSILNTWSSYLNLGVGIILTIIYLLAKSPANSATNSRLIYHALNQPIKFITHSFILRLSEPLVELLISKLIQRNLTQQPTKFSIRSNLPNLLLTQPIHHHSVKHSRNHQLNFCTHSITHSICRSLSHPLNLVFTQLLFNMSLILSST